MDVDKEQLGLALREQRVRHTGIPLLPSASYFRMGRGVRHIGNPALSEWFISERFEVLCVISEIHFFRVASYREHDRSRVASSSTSARGRPRGRATTCHLCLIVTRHDAAPFSVVDSRLLAQHAWGPIPFSRASKMTSPTVFP